jgi:hypothetical protein
MNEFSRATGVKVGEIAYDCVHMKMELNEKPMRENFYASWERAQLDDEINLVGTMRTSSNPLDKMVFIRFDCLNGYYFQSVPSNQ